MDTLEQDICAGIDRFIKLQIPFAIYRIPGENVVHFVSKDPRSEERRVGKECRSRWSPYH